MWDHLSKGKEDVANWLRRCRNVMQDFAIESRRLGPQDEVSLSDCLATSHALLHSHILAMMAHLC